MRYTPICSPRVFGSLEGAEGEAVGGRRGGRAGGRASSLRSQRLAVGYGPIRGLLARRRRPSTRPGRTVRCSAAHGRAQARAASAAFGQLVGIQCMKTGSLLHNTRGWQRQRMLEGISGTERRLQRSRRGLARTTRFLHRSTGAHIALLHIVSRLACSHVILNGTLIKVRWQYCAESGYRTLTSRDVNEFRNTRTDLCFMHMQKGRCLEEFGYLVYHVWWPQIRYITSSDHVARRRGAFDRDAVQTDVFVGL